MPSTHSPHFLAIDIGTTGIKVLLVDLDGRPAARARRDVPLRHPRPDWAAADAEGWWRTSCELIRQVLATADISPRAVSAIGVTGLMHALVPTAADGTALDEVILWFDQRCRPQVRELSERWAPRLKDWVGGVPGANGALPKLLWLRQERPKVLDGSAYLLLGKDYLRYRLTGVAATDRSDARGTGLIDPLTGDWSAPLLDAVLGISSQKMPPIHSASEVVGEVSPAAAAASGLRAGTPVIAGAGDVAATLVGINGYRPELACVYLGTGIWMAETVRVEDGRAGEMPRTRHLGSTTAAGSGVRWWCHLFGVVPEPEAIAQAVTEAEALPPGAEGVLFLPHLMGERAGRPNPHARGVWFGMTLAHGRAHLLRAILEGNACQIRVCLENADLAADRPLLLAGGGAGSPLWRRIIGAVTRRPTFTPQYHEATALGAAMLAAAGTGHFASPADAAAAWVRYTAPEEPDPREAKAYEPVYQLYRALQQALQPVFGQAAEARRLTSLADGARGAEVTRLEAENGS